MSESAVEESVTSLRSTEKQESIDRDPSWPKWDSPWWRMVLLWEVG